MFVRWLLAALLLGVALPQAWAQRQPGPAYLLRHPAGALPATWATAATVPLPDQWPPTAPTGRAALLAAGAPPLAPRRDATGVRPLYDLYRDLPEDFRRHTLPAVYVEPLPVQLLRGVLMR